MKIPTEFFNAHLDWTWRDVQFALQHGLLARDAPIQLAGQYLATHPGAPDTVLELASEDVDGPLPSLVEALAEREPRAEPQAAARCLYVLMAWIFDQRETFVDPLSVVEEVYADFDYPEQIKHIVRYMPADDLREGQVEGETLLYQNWDAYLRRIAREPNILPILRRLEDLYRDAVVAGSDADSLRHEIAVVRKMDPQLAQTLAPLMAAVEAAGARNMNLYFVAD